MLNAPIYLDNHATTPVDPRVVEKMLPYFTENFGNAGSAHAFGEPAKEAIEEARKKIASAIGAAPNEIVFTSGATESNNLAIGGVTQRRRRRGNHMVSVRTEHSSVLDPLTRLAERDQTLTILDVEPHTGLLDVARVADALSNALGDETCLVSVMLANNEIGVVQPVADIAKVCRSRGVLLHCDAAQAVGKIPIAVRELGVDLMSFTAHKLFGPKGAGALYVRRGVRLEPQQWGGGQERGRRSGTLNVPGIVGFAEAVRLAAEELSTEMPRLASLRETLARRITEELDDVKIVGPSISERASDGTPMRLPGNLNLQFPGLDGEALMLAMPDLAVSSGAACSTTDPEPSHVLTALGLSPDEARSCLRFGLGRFTTEEEIATGAERVIRAAGQLRKMAPEP